MTARPHIPNAPGITWRLLKFGWECRWRARTDIVRKGYRPKIVRLWAATKDAPEPSEFDAGWIVERATALQNDMLVWGRGGIADIINPITYDKTWASLVEHYKADPDSPYGKKEYATRRHYDTLSARIVADCGSTKIIDTDARALLRLHEGWVKPTEEGGPLKISMGHAMIGMMRTITTFGATLLKCPDCRLIRSDLRDMRVKNGKPREHHLSADQVVAIRDAAHAAVPSRASIALAQACQFDIGSGMRQKDIIGEWLPLEEPGISDVIDGPSKWLKGLRYEEIDQNLILRHITSKKKKLLVADLRLAPMVMQELRIVAGLPAGARLERSHLPATGPLVVNEQTGLPWVAMTFRQAWRKLARAAGVSDEIRNMDSRSGAITEAFESGASPDDIRKGATHSNISMTSRYSRDDERAVADVMQHRSATRNKSGTSGREHEGNGIDALDAQKRAESKG